MVDIDHATVVVTILSKMQQRFKSLEEDVGRLRQTLQPSQPTPEQKQEKLDFTGIDYASTSTSGDILATVVNDLELQGVFYCEQGNEEVDAGPSLSHEQDIRNIVQTRIAALKKADPKARIETRPLLKHVKCEIPKLPDKVVYDEEQLKTIIKQEKEQFKDAAGRRAKAKATGSRDVPLKKAKRPFKNRVPPAVPSFATDDLPQLQEDPVDLSSSRASSSERKRSSSSCSNGSENGSEQAEAKMKRS